MTIVQQPDSLSFCGNLKDFIITGESELSFSLYSGSTILIAETYTAYNNKIIIPCKKVIEQQFTICLPDTDVFVQTRGVLDFNAHIGDTTVSFRVIKGGIGDAAEVSTVFLKSQFLTLQPQQKQTLTWQPEFLNYYTQEQCRLKLRAYFADGTNEEKYIADMETGKLYTIDLSFLKVNGKFEKQVGYYDAWIENTAGNRLTYIQRYILTHPKDNSQIYVFENTLGGLDSVCFTGLFSEKLETNGNITTINDESSDSDIDFSVIYEQNTGYIPTFEYIRWLRGFFLSCQRYHVTDSFRKIYIEESENTFRLTELNSYTFEFRYSLQSKYGFVTRNQEMLPELLEFPAGDKLFFLAPRLSEFPIAAIADDLVLPAQFSFENQWRRISIAAIIQAAISASIDVNNIDLTDYWKKEELVRDELYLKFLDKKISSGYADKAGNSEKWNNKQMSELLDQPVRKTDSVQFKQVTADKITTDEIISDNFVSGPLGEGMNLIRRDSSGKSYLEIDKMFARYKAVFAALEIRKQTYAGGNYIFSPAGATCTMVEDKEGFYRCYFTADDGEKAVENLFRTDDFVQCRESNIKSGTYENISNRYYWRRCIATGDDYIDLSKSDCDTDSDIPAIGDSMVTIGNKTVSARQNAIIISVYGEGSPSFIQYKGINTFSLEGKAKIIISPDQNRFTGKFTFETGEDAEESIKNVAESAKEQGIIGGKEAINNLQIGSQNLISKQMMLRWNEKNKDIAVWGQDEDGIYLDVAPKLLFNNITTEAYNPVFDIKFKANTQYVLSVEWKHKSPNPDNTGLAFYIEYDDGTRSNVFLTKDIKTKTITNVISEAGKTISKIYSGYGNGDINALIYNISLIEGNKPLQGFPVAAEDQTGANNVNLAEGTKGPFTVEGEGTNAYAYKALYIPVIKPNTVYYVNAQNIEFLSGNISKCDFILYDKAIKKYLTTTYHHLYDKNGGILITKNDFEAQEGYLLCYAGESGHTTGNSVRFTEVMLVEGFLPASVWTPSFSEQQAEIKTITKTLTEIKAENGEISLRVNEVSERVEEAKQEAIDTANEYATLKSYRETWIDLTAEKWNRDMYYPVTIKIDITIKTRIQVDTPLDYVNVSWGTHESGGYSMLCAWTVNGGGWGSITVQRVIESSQWGWTELDPSSPNGLKIPFGSIGQLTNNNEEYILLRGGGKYRFRITNNCVPIEHNSRYTGYGGQHVDPQSSVIGPVLTNVMKTEFDSQITQLKDSIDLRVTKTDYDKNNQVLNQSIGKLQTSYNSISGTVSSLNTRLQTVEKAGYITTSQGNTLYASKKLENGNELISYINQDATNTTIKAKNINLNGAISANGNVQITTDGKLIAVNGQFTGKITATEGEIAGLKLSNNGLKSDDFNASSKVGSCYAKNGFSVYASGSGILAPSTGALQAGIITAIGTNSEIIGLEIIAKNTSGNATLSKITALKLRAIDYVDDSKKMAPTAALIVEEGVSIFNGDVEVNGKSTFNGAVYFKNVQNVNGKSNYYLCIDRSTGQLYYR
ncbi:hypothetical protein [Odoribacter splanchnicus]|uniref:hypothetical protein n=1 Tax=Odoribacter splanchnicus TaxID=28118 RepID=UPI000E54647A|nr:hypothetical protein [Odoribacter splanchnicus]RHA41210.1 hypothetical protein DW936_09530 [Odoribacter splanchnicus]